MCIMVDLSKAFDAVPHGLVLAKLSSYDFSMSAVEFIRSYLINRPQRVKLANVRSKWGYLKRGVPKGLLVGPTLFNIF